MAVTNAQELLKHELGDLLYAEKQILKAIKPMIREASDPEMRARLEQHQGETEQQIGNLERAFEAMGLKARGQKCPGILGIIEEGKSIMEEFKDTPALDAGLVSAAQAVEHYEIARYGTPKTWARQMGRADVVKLLEATEKEEINADKTLSQVAVGEANRKAA